MKYMFGYLTFLNICFITKMQGKNKCLNREMEVYIKLKDSEKTLLSRTAADKAVRQKRQGGGMQLVKTINIFRLFFR